jgi:hypothetical protein
MVNHNHEAEVWTFLAERLEQRMSRGELVVVDATHTYLPGLEGYARLIERFGYRALCLDLSQRSLEEALEGNTRRPWRARVPDHAVERVWKAARQPLPASLISAGCEVLNLPSKGSLEEAFALIAEGVRRWLLSEERPLSELNGGLPLVWGGRLPTCDLTQALTLLDAQQNKRPHLPTLWLSPLNTLFGEQAHTDEHISALSPLLQEALEARPQLSLLRGPQERDRPWWLAEHLNDATRWLSTPPFRSEHNERECEKSEEREESEEIACIDVAWSLPLTPPPVLSLASDQALLSTPFIPSESTEDSHPFTHSKEPPFAWRQEWWRERVLALNASCLSSHLDQVSVRGEWLTYQGYVIQTEHFRLMSPHVSALPIFPFVHVPLPANVNGGAS